MKKYYIIGTITAVALFGLTIPVLYCVYAFFSVGTGNTIDDPHLSGTRFIGRSFRRVKMDTNLFSVFQKVSGERSL